MSKLVEYKYVEKFYEYKCNKCKFVEWITADIIDEFADMDVYCKTKYDEEENNKRKGMPVVECSKCNQNSCFTGKIKQEENSYIAEDEDSLPF